MGRVKDALRTIGVAVGGNRLTLLGRIALLGSIAVSAHYHKNLPIRYEPESGRFERIVERVRNTPVTPANGYLALTWLILELDTSGGLGTLDKYRKTRKHIRDYGRLRPELVEFVMARSEVGGLIGYCQDQGVYLAAKEEGQLEVFNEVRTRVSTSMIPHF